MKTLYFIVNSKSIRAATLYLYLMIQNVDGTIYWSNSTESLNSFEIKPVFNCKDSKCNRASFSFVVPSLGRTLTLPLIRNMRLFTDLRDDHCHYLTDDSLPGIKLEGAINWCNLSRDGLMFNSRIAISLKYNLTKDRYFIFVPQNKSLDLLFIQSQRQSTKSSAFNVFAPPQSIRGQSAINLFYSQVLIIFDYPVYLRYNRSASALNQFAASAVNYLQANMKMLNLSMAVESLIFENESLVQIQPKLLPTMSDHAALLYNLCQFRSKSSFLDPYENYTIALLHDHNFGVNLGASTLGDICDKRGNTLIGTAKPPAFSGHLSSPQTLAVILAHEIGHLIGIPHDTPDSCFCSFAECIMSSSFSANLIVDWSDCSIDAFEYFISEPVSQCLKYSPYRAPKSAICGNGLLEEGEKCDCGQTYCNACCNGATCWFNTQTAKCGTGVCCNFANCAIHNAVSAITCRAAISECDLPEYCDGDSEFCPPDRFKHDGTPCSGGYCYKGQCENHSSQCKKLWGDDIEAGHLTCYDLNSISYDKVSELSSFGCKLTSKLPDFNNGRFDKCSFPDVQCGRLICQISTETNLSIWHTLYAYNGRAIATLSNLESCGTINYYANLRPQDLGSVPNGAACGFDYLGMCIDSRCVPLDEVLELNPCPPSCSGHGTCNDVGECSCDAGFGGVNCTLDLNSIPLS